MRRVRLTKKRAYSEHRKRKSIRNHKRRTGHLKSMKKQKGNREK
jgi:hypothetical protein